VDFLKHNPWVCRHDGYKYIKSGQICYPTFVSDLFVGFYIEQVKGTCWYLKERFEEVTGVNYHSDQTGDREDDI